MFSHVVLIGRIGRVDARPAGESGRQQTRVRLATLRKWRDLDGVLQDKTTWHTVVGWEGNAALLAEVAVGDTVCVEGYIDNDDSGGAFHSSVVAQKVLRLSSRGALSRERLGELVKTMDVETQVWLRQLLGPAPRD
ncbi:MAG TPA: single-stranded DNA-binding protein [Anaerolineae bacterium]|nr:single-stranded DNA-binding protein [Anaerolineae bacterium]